MTEKDYADRQVVGLDRYIPTRRAAILLGSLIGIPPVALGFSLSTQSFEVISSLLGEKWLTALLVSGVVAFLIALLLIIELAVVVNHDKHYPVFHFSNKNELMSFEWLYKNAASKHWIFLLAICAVSFYAGFYVANL